MTANRRPVFPASQGAVRGYARRLRTLADALREARRLATWDDARIQAYTDAYYQQQSSYRDRDYNLSGLHAWEETIVADYFADCSRVIVAGAGGGREALALCRKGMQVMAFDCNRPLLDTAAELAHQEGLALQVDTADPGALPALPGRWEGAVIGWGSYMHIRGAKQRVAFLRGLHAKLQTGAPVLLSFFTFRPPGTRLALIYRMARILEITHGRPRRVEKGDSLRGSFDHYFTRQEIVEEARQAGFRALAWSAEPYGHAVIEVVTC